MKGLSVFLPLSALFLLVGGLGAQTYEDPQRIPTGQHIGVSAVEAHGDAVPNSSGSSAAGPTGWVTFSDGSKSLASPVPLATGAGAMGDGEWTWMGGSSTVPSSFGRPAVYGTLGTPAPGNTPGGRQYAARWIDPTGNLWLFGGLGNNGLTIAFNDLWRFSPTLNEWAWMGGSSTESCSSSCGQPGVYGTLGTPAAGNIPGGRWSSSSWIDTNGNLWLYGGYGFDANGAMEWLNDLWAFNPATNQWTWMGGTSTEPIMSEGYPPVYGSQGVFAAGNNPGGRSNASAWTDSNGHFWLFGGTGYYALGVAATFNDLWEFDPSTSRWAWMSGSSVAGSNCPNGVCQQSGSFGTLGVPATGNVPGSRNSAAAWSDSSGHLWIFGGLIQNIYQLDDLWEYFPSSNQWAWMGGGSQQDQAGSYGAMGTPAAGNLPGGRSSSATWTGSNGLLWLFGGDGFDANDSPGILNDLWEFNPSTSEWAWIDGSSTVSAITESQPGVYGVLGAWASGNVPGGHKDSVSWTDKSGNFWLFGGSGADANGNLGELNDLWMYASAASAPVAATPTFSVPGGSYTSTQSVTIGDTTQGAVIYYTTNGTAPTTSSNVYSTPISVSASETLEAMATATGYTNSAVASAAYVVTPPVCSGSQTMNIDYYTIAATDQDAGYLTSGLSSNYVLSTLGANGLPIFNTNATVNGVPVSRGPHDLLGDNEITWWSPALNKGGTGGASDVKATGSGVVPLPFSNNAFYPPNGTGANDANGFQAAVLSGFLYAPTAETVGFTISSDDMAFLYLDGQIACDDGGVHPATAVPCTSSTLTAGNHTLQVFYVDLNRVAAALDFTVTTANVCTAPVQVTPTLTWATPTPINYGTPLSASQLDASSTVAGTFAYTPATGTILSAGAQPLSVTFTPTDTTDWTPATATVQLTVNPVTPTITWANPAPIAYGAPLSAAQLDATSNVAGTFAYTPASGTVLSAGTQTLSVTFTPTDAIDYTTATATVRLTVNQVTPTISWANPAPITYGTPLSAAQLDAASNVAGTFAYAPASGVVLLAGAQTLSATFTPTDAIDYTTATASVPLTVKQAPSTLNLAASVTSVPAGTAFTLTSTVSSGTTQTPTGTVTFYNGGNALGSIPLANGVATFPTAVTVNSTITASYSGDANFVGGPSNSVAITVLPATTQNLLAASPNPDPFGGTVTFTSTLSSLNGAPTGSVTFYDGTVSLAVVPLISGVAQYSTNTLAVGSHTITAIYSGAPLFAGSTSNLVVETVADFALSASPSAQTLYTGEATSYTVTITPGAGFNLPVALTCTQLPANTTCSFSTATVSGGGGSSTLTVQTTAPSKAASASVLSKRVGAPMLAGLFILFIPRRLRRYRKGWTAFLALLACVVLGAAMTGCSDPGPLAGGTPVGAQTVTITGVATNGTQTLTHATTVRLNVTSLF